jgi:hypothetical protein
MYSLGENLDGRMVLKLGCDNIDWINLVYDLDRWLIDVCVM